VTAVEPPRAAAGAREQTRARYPDEAGHVERDGVRIAYEVYGDGDPTLLLLPTWSIIHSRHWKMQIPYLARHCRVVTFDGRGNGHSDRPAGAEAYTVPEFAADALAVLDATGTERCVLAGVSCAALWGTLLAAEHPERVDGAVFICPAVALAPPHPSPRPRLPIGGNPRNCASQRRRIRGTRMVAARVAGEPIRRGIRGYRARSSQHSARLPRRVRSV